MTETTDLLTPRIVTHPRLSKETTWMAIGDLSLLDAEQFVPVILSRSLFAEKLESELQTIEAAVQRGAVAVGGFISFPEKQAAKRLAKYANLQLIRILPNPLVNYPLTEHVKQRILDGKTLILSGITGEDMNLTRANCVRNNAWILELCGQKRTLTATPVVKKSTFARPTPSQERSPTTPNSTPSSSKDDPAAIFL